MFIDIHVHCAKKRHPKLTRPNGSHYPDPETLIRMMDEAGIDMAVVQTTSSVERRYITLSPEEVLEICGEYPDRLIPFCNMDPRFLTNDETADFTPLLEAYKELGCKGVGECIPNLPFDDPLCMNFFKHVERAGLPLTFHVAPKAGGYYGFIDEVGLPRLEKVLKAFPNLMFLAHSQPFWAEIGTNVVQDGERVPYPKGPVTPGRVVELMRTYPNLLGDLSAGSGFGAISRDPEFGYGFMEEFQDRLFWGTDIANVPQDLPIVDYFRELKANKRISDEAYEKITWRNANRLLNLGLE
ncbi:MAG: amidohydrolase family protein [Candidatus Hydrogenedentes bacterium]|nr:amidohydrolase family protein [Candidatus Hydrogenedentota bacterium]